MQTLTQDIKTDELVTFLLGEVKDEKLLRRVSKRIQEKTYNPEFNEFVELGENMASDFARELRDKKIFFDVCRTAG